MKNQKGVTLVALVVTIIVLIILVGISINLLLGENGLITKAQEAKKQQKIAEIKEKISLELAAAETDAIIRNESLEEEQLNDIVSKYGTLQDDKDTILTKDDNYKISLKEIWYGTLSTSGSYSDKKKQIEMLEKELKELQNKYNELEQTNSGNTEILKDLRSQITTLENEKKTLEDNLKAEQDKNKTLETQMADLNSKYDNLKNEYDKFFNDPGTATARDIVEGKTAWVNGNKITGTMEIKTTTIKNYGSVSSGNISADFPNYKDMTSSNFFLVCTGASASPGRVGGNPYGIDSSSISPKINYNSTDGSFTVSNTSINKSGSSVEIYTASLSISYNVICVY